jgi:hypothetical protein
MCCTLDLEPDRRTSWSSWLEQYRLVVRYSSGSSEADNEISRLYHSFDRQKAFRHDSLGVYLPSQIPQLDRRPLRRPQAMRQVAAHGQGERHNSMRR